MVSEDIKSLLFDLKTEYKAFKGITEKYLFNFLKDETAEDCYNAFNLMVNESATIGYSQAPTSVFLEYLRQVKNERRQEEARLNRPKIEPIRPKTFKSWAEEYQSLDEDGKERWIQGKAFKLSLIISNCVNYEEGIVKFKNSREEFVKDVREAVEAGCDVLELPKYWELKQSVSETRKSVGIFGDVKK